MTGVLKFNRSTRRREIQESGVVTEDQQKQSAARQAMACRAVLGTGLLAAGYLLGATTGWITLQAIYAGCLLAISYTDVRERRVPNIVVYPAIVLALGAVLAHPDWWRYILGGAVAALLLAIPVFIYGPERAGIGDVKLAFFVGLILGCSAHLYWALVIGFASGALAGGIGILLGRLHRKSTLPFGTFLALGTLLVLLLRA